MPQSSLVTDSTASKRHPASLFTCRWEAGSCAAWVHVAGELDRVGSPQLEQVLGEAGLDARLVALDLRDLTFIDSAASSSTAPEGPGRQGAG
jgi:hypothetical protein